MYQRRLSILGLQRSFCSVSTTSRIRTILLSASITAAILSEQEHNLFLLPKPVRIGTILHNVGKCEA